MHLLVSFRNAPPRPFRNTSSPLPEYERFPSWYCFDSAVTARFVEFIECSDCSGGGGGRVDGVDCEDLVVVMVVIAVVAASTATAAFA